MKRFISLSTIFLSLSLNAQVKNIDHFFATSPKADILFKLFRTKFQLPVEWDYKTYGGFSSGAITLGNVAFEFVNYKEVNQTKFNGIAFLPQQSVEEIIPILDLAHVKHDTIEANTYLMSNGNIAGWSNMGLHILPKGITVFIYDYKNRAELAQSIKKTRDSLAKNNGGPLGIIQVKEIVVNSNNLVHDKAELKKLPGVFVKDGDLYTFNDGPSIRLINSNSNGINKIIIKIRSVEIAKKYLKLENLLGNSSKNSIFINTIATDGLLIELIDQ